MKDEILKSYFFNTGRGYTEHGQRIVVVLWKGNFISFLDIDRSVRGTFVYNDQWERENTNIDTIKRLVMFAYDNGMYQHPAREESMALEEAKKEKLMEVGA